MIQESHKSMLLPSKPILDQQFAIKSLYEYIHSLQQKGNCSNINHQFPFFIWLFPSQLILLKFPYKIFADFAKQCYNSFVVNSIRQRKEVSLLISFTLSVLASIVAYYICK